jgi:flagellar hook-length control protein FliK
VQGAEVRITPPQLGPIDIRISIQNDQANVTFAAQHGVVREALEASIPRLREMMSENNLQLVNVDVNQRNSSEQRASHFLNQSSSGEQDGEGYEFEEDEEAGNSVLTLQSDGLVDDFA